MEPVISIIVPVYNTSKYLDRCISSLLSQSFKNFEVILVDDGSTDNSAEVCRRYVNEKVKLYSKQNGGLFDARNFGIKHMSESSQYCCFVDSDDTINSDYLKKLYDSIIISAADLSCGGIKNIYKNQSDNIPQEFELKAAVYDDVFNNYLFANRLKTGFFNSACTKLYKTEIIRKYNLYFENIKIAEDICFNFKYLHFCSKIIVLDDKIYNYYHNEGSLTSQGSADMYSNYVSLQQQMLQDFSNSLSDEINRFVYPQYLAITQRLVRSGNHAEPKEWLKNEFIKKAINAYKATCLGDYALLVSMRYRLFKLLNILS